MNIQYIDIHLIRLFKKISEPIARLSLFVVFFWFGILKVFNVSPASPLVEELFVKTVQGMTFSTFLLSFGILEVLIGILFLIRGYERLVIPLLFLHMITTTLPLALLPSVTWSGFFIPTLEGQYIIKNIAIIAVAIGIAAQLYPLRKKLNR